MFISFGNTKKDQVGGAAQGIIPVQDVQGNMLGWSAPSSPELVGQVGEVRREAQGVKGELTKLEEYFEKMVEAVERNTEQVAALANKQQADDRETRQKQDDGDRNELSGYLARINELLDKNSESMDTMAKRQSENDEQLRAALQDFSSHHKPDSVDIPKLSAHLDRIQSIMEQNITERNDSKEETTEHQPRAVANIDWSPLIDRLEKVQGAVEQNSALVKALLDEGTANESKSGTPFWAGNQTPPSQAPPADLTPLTEHLQKIHSAIEQQSNHMQALVGFATGDEGGAGPLASGPGDTAEKNLAPLGEHLEQIYNAIEEGNKHAKEVASRTQPGQLDLSPLTSHLEALRRSAADNNHNIEALLQAHNGVRVATESGGKVDMTPLANKLDEVTDQLRRHLESQDAIRQSSSKLDLRPLEEKFDVLNDHTKKLLASQIALRATAEAGRNLDLAPLTGKFDVLSEHLEALLMSSDQNASNLKQLIDAQEGVRAEVSESGKPDFAPLGEKLDGLSEHLESLREWTEFNAEQFKDFVDSSKAEREAANPTGTVDLSPLADHLGAIRTATEQNGVHMKALLDAHEQGSRPTNNEIDLTPLTDRLNHIHSAIEKQAEQPRDQSPGTGDSRFLMSALTSHLSRIQAVTEQNAQHVKVLRETHAAGTTTPDKIVTEQIRALAEYQARNEERVDATGAQVRALMAGQKEMVDVMRELARSITAQNKGACDHVVVPPPRKVGRRIVGFVYDAKDGPV